MPPKLFDDGRTYRRAEIAPKLGNPSPRTLATILRRIPRVVMGTKFAVYCGRDLNTLVEDAMKRSGASA